MNHDNNKNICDLIDEYVNLYQYSSNDDRVSNEDNHSDENKNMDDNNLVDYALE